jgi:hypothetical protein
VIGVLVANFDEFSVQQHLLAYVRVPQKFFSIEQSWRKKTIIGPFKKQKQIQGDQIR